MAAAAFDVAAAAAGAVANPSAHNDNDNDHGDHDDNGDVALLMSLLSYRKIENGGMVETTIQTRPCRLAVYRYALSSVLTTPPALFFSGNEGGYSK